MSDIQAHIEAVEIGYEFLLAYAAQGREDDDKNRPGPYARDTLEAMIGAVDGLTEAIDGSAHAFNQVVLDDLPKARAAIELILRAPKISSELVDNLNASIHLRTVLTDLFILSESLENPS
ncbi:MAG: hypothetical protein V3R27_10115 [Pseudomonadales bacterium]